MFCIVTAIVPPAGLAGVVADEVLDVAAGVLDVLDELAAGVELEDADELLEVELEPQAASASARTGRRMR
jgi:hypothetical protein